MKSIIEALYDGVTDERNRVDKRKDLTKEKEFLVYETLMATLNAEQKDLLDKFLEELTIRNGERRKELYCRAFKLGVKIGMETAAYDPYDW